MQFVSETTHSDLVERLGAVTTALGDVPLVVWSPVDGPGDCLVAVGHGAAGDKHEGYVVALARHLVTKYRATVVAIDGPVHGDRRASLGLSGSEPFLDFVAAWSSQSDLTDRSVNEWTATLDALLASPLVSDGAPVGYWGLSMGTILGLPFVAHDARVQACVLGLMGATGPTKDRIVADAERISIPTLFIVQWNDQFFGRRESLELYDVLGTQNKTLVANPGFHGAVPPSTFTYSADFLMRSLRRLT